MGWENQGPKQSGPLCKARLPSQVTHCNLCSWPTWLQPDSPFPNRSAGARTRREGADSSSGAWHRSQAICSQLPPAWVVAARPQPAPTPLTSRQRTLTLSLCVLSNLPNIAARSLSTVLFHAFFSSPKYAKSAVPSLNGCISCHASPSALASGDSPPPWRKCAWRSHPSFHDLGYLAQDGSCARTYWSDIKGEESRGLEG